LRKSKPTAPTFKKQKEKAVAGDGTSSSLSIGHRCVAHFNRKPLCTHPHQNIHKRCCNTEYANRKAPKNSIAIQIPYLANKI
jgi:hypothetical protein